ncbi:hypothetical protein C2E23DRAFT_778581 [Lenzites betulinus]|nr:hypothetical protein C2E23DRAFT_778581 [Lenzites betulinus]
MMHPLLDLDSLSWKFTDWTPPTDVFNKIMNHLSTVRRDITHAGLRSSLHMNADGKLRSFLLVSFPCALLATIFYTAACCRSKEKVLPGTRAALVSLYAFITPTQSFWPPQYLSIARAAATSRDKALHLPLGTLYSDLLDDVVELRYLGEHLPLLFANKLSLPTPIRLHIELFWWGKLLWFMFSCYMRSSRPFVTLITKHEGANNIANPALPCSPPPPYPRATEDLADACPTSTPPSTLFFSMLYENAPSVSLDCVPYHTLERAIRKLQNTLASGSHLTIGLTTRAGPAAQTFNDPRTILTALPFLPRAYLRGRSSKPAGAGGPNESRTTTPLFATLPRVLELLTSGPAPLNVVLVRNVSTEYAVFLRRSAHALDDDWEIRDAFVREWGAEAWREERVCTMWEAALVDAGMLTGWAVVVRKPE